MPLLGRLNVRNGVIKFANKSGPEVWLFPEHLSPEILIAIAVVVGSVLTILLLTLFILFAVRTEKCCCAIQNKKKLSDVER